LNGVTGPDDPDGMRHSFLEVDVRLEFESDAIQSMLELQDRLSAIYLVELLSHESSGHTEVAANGCQYIENSRHIIDQGNIYCLDFLPKGKPTICNNQRIGMPDKAKERVDFWV
jgi:hypothetical protein